MPTSKIKLQQLYTTGATQGQVPTVPASGALAYQDGPLALALINHEPTGFPNRVDSLISFDDANRRFQITPAVTSFDIYINGVKYTKSAPATVDIDDTEGIWYIYYNSSAALVASQTPWDLSATVVPITLMYWDATNNKAVSFADERHGLVMDWKTHYWAHTTVGTRYPINGGLAAGNYTIVGDGSLDSHAQLSFSDGSIQDEDIDYAIKHAAVPANLGEQYLTTIAKLPVWYRSGVSGNWRCDAATNFPLKAGVARPTYNNPAGPWTTPDASNGYFIAMWIVATTSIGPRSGQPSVEPIIAIMGQREDNIVGNAITNNTPESLQLGSFPVAEAKILFRLIFQVGAYGNAISARLRVVSDYRTSSVVAGATFQVGDHSALAGRSNSNQHPASAIAPDTSAFNGALTSADDTVQKALDTLDDFGAGKIVRWVKAINLKAIAQTTLYTVPTGKRFIPIHCVVGVETITGGAAMPTIQFGTTGTPNLIVAAEQLDASMNAANKTQGWIVLGDMLAAGTVLEFGVTVGGTSTTHTGVAIITGFLIDA